MNAGLLSDLVVFEEKTFTLNQQGQIDEAWGTGFTAWAEATRTSEQSARFVIYYRDDVTPLSHRILWDGAIWLLTNVVRDRKRAMLEISSDFSALIETTHLQSVFREYIEGLPVLRPLEDSSFMPTLSNVFVSVVTGFIGPTGQHIIPGGAVDTFVLENLAQTVTNKTLTAPTINGGTLSGTFTILPTAGFGITFSSTSGHSLLRTENTTANVTHLRLGRGTGAGLNVSLGTTGGGANDATAFLVSVGGVLSTWSAAVLALGGGLSATSVRGNAVAFASLPASPVEGMLVGVTDSNTATWGAAIAGGGANHVLAYYNGSAWTVAAK